MNRNVISRRRFLAAATAAVAGPRLSWSAEVRTPTLLDHILVGSADLDDGIAFVEKRTGVRAAFGGVHPGAGTRNALLSLGRNRYLEIIAPDPQQPSSADARDLRSLGKPVLVGWAAHVGDIEQFAARLAESGIPTGGVRPGSRRRPDGRVLAWKTLALKDDAGGLLPFFIEWSADALHPSADAPLGCSLTLFEAATPRPDMLGKRLDQLQLDLPVAQGKNPQLHATITGPRGQLDVTF